DRNFLSQVMFILQNPPRRPPALPGLSARFTDIDPGIARADLLLELMETDGRLGGWFEYSADVFDAETIARMAAHLETLLAAVAQNPDERILHLRLLPDAERRRLTVDWTRSANDVLGRGTFTERFLAQADAAPDSIAASAGDVQLSYGALLARASAIANGLARGGVGADIVVILAAQRGLDLLAGMIAVHLAGGAFLPLHPKLPVRRIAQISERSRATVIVAGESCVAAVDDAVSRLAESERPKVLSFATLAQGEPLDRKTLVRSAPSNLAYVIYTSGSTGMPKG